MSATKADMIRAYRNLYRASLRAVQYSSPGRHVIRERLRFIFKASEPNDFSAPRISKTLEFLANAAAYKGVEHKVIKNLVHVWWAEPRQWRGRAKRRGKPEALLDTKAYEGFYHTLRMLNESLGTCIR